MDTSSGNEFPLSISHPQSASDTWKKDEIKYTGFYSSGSDIQCSVRV